MYYELSYLTGKEYAEKFKQLTGEYPKLVPISGTLQTGRKWGRYHE